MYRFLLILLLTFTSYSFAQGQTAIAPAQHGMVVTSQHYATEVGNEILRQGGNAIDAAVAVGYALAVVEPCCGNIGGGGFMLIRFRNQHTTFLNFREQAPQAANARLFLNTTGKVDSKKTLSNYTSVAVPGTVLGLESAREKYGRLSRATDLAPAIRLAEQGFVLQPFDVMRLEQARAKAPALQHHRFKVGETWRQPELAQTLKLLAREGTPAFYHGSIAKKIVAAAKQQGGLLTLNDFSHYQVYWQRPLTCSYHHLEITTAPLPSSGGIALCEMLKILEHYPLSSTPFHSVQSIHWITEAMRRAFEDRNQLGDPRFTTNFTRLLLSPTHIKNLIQTISPDHATPSSLNLRYQAESYDTTHYSIVDTEGNAVAVTYTLNGFFGSGLIADHTGFFLNNSMDDFSFSPSQPNQFGLMQGKNNLVQGGKQSLSSMTPTIVTKNHQLYLVLGAPGGPRIITQILITLLNKIDYHMTLADAVNQPRFHHQALPDIIYAEPTAIDAHTQQQLQQMNYSIATQPTWGAIEAIEFDPQKNKLYGVNDYRRPAGLAE